MAYHGCAYWRQDTHVPGVIRWENMRDTSRAFHTKERCLHEVRHALLRAAMDGSLYSLDSVYNKGPPEDNITYAGHRPLILVRQQPLPTTFLEYEWKIPS